MFILCVQFFLKLTNNLRANLFTLKMQRFLFVLITRHLKSYDLDDLDDLDSYDSDWSDVI